MQKFTCAIFGFFVLLFIIQDLIPQSEAASSTSSSLSSSSSSSSTSFGVRIAKVKKSRHDKRQTQHHQSSRHHQQQQLRGFTDIPFDDNRYSRSGVSVSNSNSNSNSNNYRRQASSPATVQVQVLRPEDNPYNAGKRQADYPTRNPNEDRYVSTSAAASQGSARKPIRNDDDEHCEGCDGDGIPGDPGVDYPIYATLPKTSFDCKQQEWPGYYSDTEAKCQVFWICQRNRGDAFLCPNGTLFNQQLYVCDWWYNVDCATAPDFYSRNQYIYAGPGIDIFGNQVTVKQSTSVSSGSDRNEFVAATAATRRPTSSASSAEIRQITSAATNINRASNGNNGNGGTSTREILQAIESAAQSGTGGNTYRREINTNRRTLSDQIPRSSSSSSSRAYHQSNSREPVQYRSSSTPSSRQIPATTIPPYNNNNDQQYRKSGYYSSSTIPSTSTTTQKRYENEEDEYYALGFRKSPAAASETVSVKTQPIRENQIQNPFVKQSSSSSSGGIASTSPRQSISSGTAKPQVYYSSNPVRSSSTSTTTSGTNSDTRYYQPKQQSSPSHHSQQKVYKYDSSSNNNNNGAYLPTASTRPSTSTSSSTQRNPFIISNSNSNGNYKPSNQQRPSTSNSSGARRENYYLGGVTTKRNVIESDEDFEKDYEDGLKFNYAKTYSPAAAASSGTITQVRSPPISISDYGDEPTTTPKPKPLPIKQQQQLQLQPSIISNSNKLYSDEQPRIIIVTTKPLTTTTSTTTTTTKAPPPPLLLRSQQQQQPTPSIFALADDDYGIKVIRQPLNIVKSIDEPTELGGFIDYGDIEHEHSRRSSSTTRNNNHAAKKYSNPADTHVEELETDFHYHHQRQPKTDSSKSKYIALDKYISPNTNQNNFQGSSIVSKYNTKTSYNDGDDENYIELLRALSAHQQQQAPTSSSAASEPIAATSLAPVHKIYQHPLSYDLLATDTSNSAYLQSATTTSTTSTSRPIVIPSQDSSNITAAPVFGKKIKSGRKRNSSNWQNYFFKNKN